MPARRIPAFAAAAGLTLALALMQGCGKVSAPVAPAGSTYPHVYPATAQGANVQTSRVLGPPTVGGPLFTSSGSWIDPSVHLPHPDPYADIEITGPNGQTNSLTGSPNAVGATHLPYSSDTTGEQTAPQ